MSDATPRNQPHQRDWFRRYPPLVSFIVALLIMFLVMPSALNLPQANPSTVLEYAPVPPENDDPPPPVEGSLGSLSLGSSQTLSTGSDLDENLNVPPTERGGGKRPITKRCVGTPPRQTEDPNSPPCVPFFEGDNGGETFQGVTKDEIVVLIYASGNTINQKDDDAPEQSPAVGTYCDVDAEPDSNPDCADQTGGIRDYLAIRNARALSRTFNERYQTYGRHVHFWVYFSSGFATTSVRRADAQDNWETLKPFAVIDTANFGGYNDVYAEGMTRRLVSVYSGFAAQPNKLYRDNAPFLWTFWPDVEHWVDMYYSYLCQKVIGRPVRHSGNDADVGKPRRYGLLSTSNSGFPGLQMFARSVESKLRAGCPNGAKPNIVGEYYFPNAQYSQDTDPAATTAARQNVAQMVADGVTTVLWLGGQEAEHSKAARVADFYPEWVIAGDLVNDRNGDTSFQDQEVFRHAWHMSNQLREDKTEDAPCVQAYKESDPTAVDSDVESGCDLYRPFFMLFRAIQVAGAFLTPEAVDQGNHAIPRQASNDPYTAACFYDPGDFTCVKDAQESWWDPDAPDPDGDPAERGCWRMVRGGKRFLPGTWEGDDGDLFANPSDPCNNVKGSTYGNLTGGL